MHVLLTNDDGISSPGLAELHRVLSPSHRVTVVAPDRERSAVGHGITLHAPLRARRIPANGEGGCLHYAVSGTPADCVKLALAEILQPQPDMVIAGINPGENVGASINYSGTVAAAKEAALFGIPAISVSIQGRSCLHMDSAARFAARLALLVQRKKLPFGTFLNVNVPDLPWDQLNGVRISRQSVERLMETFEKRIDPRNQSYYWFGPDPQRFDGDPDADGAALKKRCISITPIKCDSTDHELLKDLRGWGLSAGGGDGSPEHLR
jgi:5'-nucleotidase